MAVGWASARPLRVELAAVAFVYALYQAGHGVASNEFAAADRNAHRIADLERTLGIFWEQSVQQAAAALPLLPNILALSYVTLHLGVTLLVLVWLYRRHPVAYARARTTLLGATAIALVVHVAFPTAPPRLAPPGADDSPLLPQSWTASAHR